MKLKLLTLSLLLSASILAKTSVNVDVDLYPMGDFIIKSNKIMGKLKSKGNKLYAKELRVPVKSLKTGLNLRDKHMKERFEPKKYPYIIVKNARGDLASGEGTADFKILGVTKKAVKIKLKKLKNNHVQATFKLNLPDFKFKEINYKGVGVEDEVKGKIVLPY